MSRHRKIKALDYNEEYDDLYGDYDDDDFDEGAFEAQYLDTGIDLKLNESSNSNTTLNKQKQKLIDESSEVERQAVSLLPSIGYDALFQPKLEANTPFVEEKRLSRLDSGKDDELEAISSDLTKIAIQHLDKHQWQLPLLEMDKKFRDKTYYRHYTDTYISSLRSKLGHFLTDDKLIDNPMKYHVGPEKDNFRRHSRMFELLTDYYQSLGAGFFTFSTPSPDEEIVIGCRLGTKVSSTPSIGLQTNRTTPRYLFVASAVVKSQKAKVQATKDEQSTKTARFEYQGKSQSSSNTKGGKKGANTTSNKPQPEKQKSNDITIRESHTVTELDDLARSYWESCNLVSDGRKAQPFKIDSDSSAKLTGDKSKILSTNKASTSKVVKPSTSTQRQPLKQLASLTEKRNKLREKIKRNAEPSDQDKELFKKRAIQTTKEYEKHLSSLARPRINLVVVGHVDAGKSTLVGHLLHKLGQINSKQMHRFEVDSKRSGKASFKFAWALDETAEERARGVTIDIALTRFETSKREVVLLDAPGHVDFVPAVISGAAQADAALLVVDATRGEFETGFTAGGQTREHTFLVRSLGVKSLIVVVNKMDTVEWSFERFKDIKEQLDPFLKLVGFKQSDVQYVVCSGLTGENLIDNRIDVALKNSSHPQMELDSDNWKSLPCLIKAIDEISTPDRMVDRPLRVCITDVYKGISSGVFLGGKVLSGKLESKQKLVLLPPNEQVEIKSVSTEGATNCDLAFAGDIVTVVASGIDLNKYYRGCILSETLIPCKATNRFQARIVMFQNASTVLVKGSPIEVHINGTFESGEVRRLISLLNKTTGELMQSKPRCLARSSSAIIQLKLSRIVCCELYEDNKDLGRFMMRSFGKTIAAGLIVKIKSAKVEKSSRFRSK